MNMTSDDELRIFQEAWQYLADHRDPPGSRDPGAEAWWMAAAEDARAADLRWKGHPLLRGLLTGIYAFLAEKAEARTKSCGAG